MINSGARVLAEESTPRPSNADTTRRAFARSQERGDVTARQLAAEENGFEDLT